MSQEIELVGKSDKPDDRLHGTVHDPTLIDALLDFPTRKAREPVFCQSSSCTRDSVERVDVENVDRHLCRFVGLRIACALCSIMVRMERSMNPFGSVILALVPSPKYVLAASNMEIGTGLRASLGS